MVRKELILGSTCETSLLTVVSRRVVRWYLLERLPLKEKTAVKAEQIGN